MIAKNKTKKFISALLIVFIILPSVLFLTPRKAEAFWFSTWLTDVSTTVTAGTTSVSAGAEVTNTALSIKDFAKEILEQVLRAVASRLLQQMTKSTINWINSGFHGAPLFVENPKSFFRDIQKYEIKTLIDLTGYNGADFPFGKQFALNVIGSYKQQFADNARYTLGKVLVDPVLIRKYQTDFNFGGWNGFLVNTQYPQNNYIGYQMLATEELARRIEQPVNNNIKKVQDTLQKGMGFLSPETCPSNPLYNNLTNEFKKPSFKSEPFTLPAAVYESTSEAGGQWNPSQGIEYRGPETEASRIAREQYAAQWQSNDYRERALWSTSNTCPGGLVSTTPGSVVASQIFKALGASQDQTGLAAQMKGSVSAIFDALLNKFLGSGLNALASKVNPRAPVDDWSYEGQTLGSPVDPLNDTWADGPDEEIILDKFKKQLSGRTIVNITDATGARTTTEEVGDTRQIATPGSCSNITGSVLKTQCDAKGGTWKDAAGREYIPGDIVNTEAELVLIYNESTSNPGVIQMLSATWPKARELDICQPGPDLKWEDRTTDEMSRNSKKLQEKLSDDNGEKSAQADLALKELKFAVNFFKDWIKNQMMKDLPSSVLYMDAVDEVGDLAQQSDELTDRRRTRTQALARLRSIETGLAAFTTQPEPGSSQEKILISLRKQYNATRVTISNGKSVDDMRNELAISKERFVNLTKLTTQCTAERSARGWSVPGGPLSTISGATEKAIYCDNPIKGGYNHETFTHANDDPANPITHSEIPYVNAKKVLKWRGFLGLFGHSASIEMSCNTIWKANVLDYKGNLPGATNIGEPYTLLPEDGSEPNLGTCTVAALPPSDPTDPTSGLDAVTEAGVTENDCNANGGTWVPDVPEIVIGTCSVTFPGGAAGTTSATQSECTAQGGTWAQ